MMRVMTLLLLVAACMASASAADRPRPAAGKAAAPAPIAEADSGQLEKDLQGLSWSRFRSVIEAVPKMKADVEAYGSMGWKFVESNYKGYGWKKNIDKLDKDQKAQLAKLVAAAKAAK